MRPSAVNHTPHPAPVLPPFRAGSLNVRLMAHGEKPFYEKTVRRIVEVHQGHEAPVFGAVKPPPRRSPRAETGGWGLHGAFSVA